MSNLQETFERQLKFLNVSEYHKQGYKGKGCVILNAEGAGDHQDMTNRVIKDFAPEATLINGYFSGRTSGDSIIEYGVVINGFKTTLEEAIEKYNIKIITRSYSGSTPKAILEYFKRIQELYGVIFFCSAGNEGTDGVTGIWAKDNTAIAVGAASINGKDEIKLHYYSARGDELDFVTFLGRGQGTSAASPALAAQTALLLQRYGDFNQIECIEILKSLCIDLGDRGRDNSYGYGIPVLPLTDKLEILEKLRGEKMKFTDVKKTDWFFEDVNFCVENGLMHGDGDDTFEPLKPVTRAEEAATTRRIYEKIMQKLEGRI